MSKKIFHLAWLGLFFLYSGESISGPPAGGVCNKKLKIGPVIVFHSATETYPGNFWGSIQNKIDHLHKGLLDGRALLVKKVKERGYHLSESDIIIPNKNTFQKITITNNTELLAQYGLSRELFYVPKASSGIIADPQVDGVPFDQGIILSTGSTDPTFGNYIKALKTEDSIPLVLVDAVDGVPYLTPTSSLGATNVSKGYIAVGYFRFGIDIFFNFQKTEVLSANFQSLVLPQVIAHEFAHALDVGHGKLVGAGSSESLMVGDFSINPPDPDSKFVLDAPMAARITSAICSDGLKPRSIGVWSLQHTKDAFTGDRKLDRFPAGPMEEAEHTFAGYIYPAEMTTTKMDDIVTEDGGYLLKMCPVIQTINVDNGNTEPVPIPHAVSNAESPNDAYHVYKKFEDAKLTPLFRYAIAEDLSPAVKAGSCHTFCSLACKLGAGGSNEYAATLCHDWCGDSADFYKGGDWLISSSLLGSGLLTGEISCGSNTNPNTGQSLGQYQGGACNPDCSAHPTRPVCDTSTCHCIPASPPPKPK